MATAINTLDRVEPKFKAAAQADTFNSVFSGTNEPFLDKNLENYIKFASDHGFIDIMLNIRPIKIKIIFTF